ncbi:MAG: DUF58 domain-containing protein [Deltaproteobacteria bacterium]|nr:DUF58 domain-containing protein [Deltaproteobacteria bacterium]
MNIYPTRTAAELALAGLAVFAVGVVLREPNVLAWGGALVLGVAATRAVTLLSVLRIRNAGFEMLWPDARRMREVRRGETFILRAEVRNRDSLAARYDKLRVIASPDLECTVEPPAGEVKASSSVELTVRVRARRVGYHGIYGLALEVRGAPGLFEVPLTFANPFGVVALPRASGRLLASPNGGRSATAAPAGRSSARRGDGTELRELRELVAGDSFRRIAWKASARRGKLMARELEREEHDTVLLLLDASVELWAGTAGEAPLDMAIDAVAGLATDHVARGDTVGLVVFAARELGRVPFDRGRPQLEAIVRAVVTKTGILDADRSGWGETDIAVQVAEHLRPIDARGLRDLRRGRLDRLAERATTALKEAPFSLAPPAGFSPTDAALRHYAASFGLHGPPRLDPERERSSEVLQRLLLEASSMKRPRPSVVHVVAPPPLSESVEGLRSAVRALRRKGVVIRWSTPPLAAGLAAETLRGHGESGDEPEAMIEPTPALVAALRRATEARAGVAERKGDVVLRSLGVKVSRASAMTRGPRAVTSAPPGSGSEVA